MAEAMYAGAGQGADGSAGVDAEHGATKRTAAAPAGPGGAGRRDGDDVVDAEFRATDDKK